MGRVGPDGAGARRQPRIGAAFGAVAVQHVGLERGDQAAQAQPDQKIFRRGFPADRHPMHAELQPWRKFGQRLVRTLATREAIGENPDVMAAINLAIGEVEDVPEDASDGRAYSVQDAKWLVGRGEHDQNQRTEPDNVLEISRWIKSPRG